MYIDWLQLIGRLHPVVLHLPIGLIVGIFGYELVRCLRRDERAEHAPFVLILLSALTSTASVISGLFLAREGYTGLGIEFHRWLGIMTAALAVLLAFLRYGKHGKPRTGYCFTLALQLVTLGITGHLGGVITHGESFLTEPFRKRSIGENQSVDPYLQVAAIFESKCVSCHNPQKAKGGLQLHSLEALMNGGDSGPSVILGSPDDSELLYRIVLPLDDDEHMPPPNKPQLSPTEIEVVRAWIEGTELPENSNVAQTASADSLPPTPNTPDETAIRALRETGVHVSELAIGSAQLWIDFSVAASPLSAERIEELLNPLAPWVQHLTLARCPLPRSLTQSPELFASLTRLDLRSALITDDFVHAIGKLASLRELVAPNTNLTDAAASHLAKATNLRKLYLWNTKISDEALAEMMRALPHCEIDRGMSRLAAKLETEGDVKLSNDAPLLRTPDQTATLKPENTTCPVSGSPIDPRYTVVYEGRLIGFCCPNCPKAFWEDPVTYLAKISP